MEVAARLAVFLVGGSLLVAAVRAVVREVIWRTGAGYLALTLLFFAPTLLAPAHGVGTDLAYRMRPWSETVGAPVVPRNPLLADPLLQMLPFRALVRGRLLDGEMPLWAHETGTGAPLLGNAQSAPFAPLHLLALVLPPLPAMTVAAAWQVLLALLLAHALLLSLGASPRGAALAAVAFALSSYSVAWLYYPVGMTAAWLPGVLLGVVLVRRRAPRGFALLVATGLGAALSGHPESLAHLALAALAAALALAFRGPGGAGFLARLGAAAAVAFCLAAPVLLPVVGSLPGSERMALLAASPEAAAPPAFEPRFLLPVVEPLVDGSPRDGNYEGPWNWNELASGYAGAVTLALAIAGAILLGGRVLAVFLAGLACLVGALKLPPVYPLLVHLPLLAHAAHGRLRLLWVLAVAVAAGLSVERLAATPGRRWGSVTLLAAMAVGLLLLAPPAAPWQRAWWVAAMVGVGATAVAAVASGPSSPSRRWGVRALAWTALAAVVLDLGLLGCRYNPAVPDRLDLAPPPALAAMRSAANASVPPLRVVAEKWDLLPNLGALYGLWDPRGNDPMRPAAAARFVGERLDPAFELGGHVLVPPGRYDQAAFDYLRVGVLLTRHRRRLGPPWELVFDGQGGKVWRNPEALPLFFFPAATTAVQGGEGAEEALAEALALPDFRRRAVVESRAAAHEEQRGEVSVLAVPANGFDLAVASERGGVVASSVSWVRGWRLEIDGRRQTTLRVNGAFLGFAVPAGHHRVRLRYRPWGWRAGWLLAASAALALLAVGFVRRRG